MPCSKWQPGDGAGEHGAHDNWKIVVDYSGSIWNLPINVFLSNYWVAHIQQEANGDREDAKLLANRWPHELQFRCRKLLAVTRGWLPNELRRANRLNKLGSKGNAMRVLAFCQNGPKEVTRIAVVRFRGVHISTILQPSEEQNNQDEQELTLVEGPQEEDVGQGMNDDEDIANEEVIEETIQLLGQEDVELLTSSRSLPSTVVFKSNPKNRNVISLKRSDSTIGGRTSSYGINRDVVSNLELEHHLISPVVQRDRYMALLKPQLDVIDKATSIIFAWDDQRQIVNRLVLPAPTDKRRLPWSTETFNRRLDVQNEYSNAVIVMPPGAVKLHKHTDPAASLQPNNYLCAKLELVEQVLLVSSTENINAYTWLKELIVTATLIVYRKAYSLVVVDLRGTTIKRAQMQAFMEYLHNFLPQDYQLQIKLIFPEASFRRQIPGYRQPSWVRRILKGRQRDG